MLSISSYCIPSVASSSTGIHVHVGVDFVGQPGCVPQYLRDAHAFISSYHIFSPTVWFAPPIFLPSLYILQCPLGVTSRRYAAHRLTAHRLTAQCTLHGPAVTVHPCSSFLLSETLTPLTMHSPTDPTVGLLHYEKLSC